AQADNRPVAPAGNFEFAVEFARVVGCLHMLETVFDPFDGTAELARGKWDQKILRIEFATHAKSAADVELDQVDGAFRHLHHCSEGATVEERHFGCAVDDKSSRGSVPLGNNPARLHR